MLDSSKVKFDSFAIHKVGNKLQGEEVRFGDQLIRLTPALEETLLNYFLKPFKADQFFSFHHASDLGLNEVCTFSRKIFAEKGAFLTESVKIAKHLYEQSTHPRIKSGELYIALFTGFELNKKAVEAIGIFKSERKETFIKVEDGPHGIEVNAEKGINTKTLDKGCLIFNSKADQGFEVLTVDSQNDETHFWIEKFLNLVRAKDEVFQTESCLTMCKEYSETVLSKNEDKTDEILFLKKAVEYFNTHDVFKGEEFAREVIGEDAEEKNFVAHQRQFEKQNQTELDSSPISKVAVKKAKRQFRNLIRLDTKMEIRLKFSTSVSEAKYIERGFDERRKMPFYKLFFNEET